MAPLPDPRNLIEAIKRGCQNFFLRLVPYSFLVKACLRVTCQFSMEKSETKSKYEAAPAAVSSHDEVCRLTKFGLARGRTNERGFGKKKVLDVEMRAFELLLSPSVVLSNLMLKDPGSCRFRALFADFEMFSALKEWHVIETAMTCRDYTGPVGVDQSPAIHKYIQSPVPVPAHVEELTGLSNSFLNTYGVTLGNAAEHVVDRVHELCSKESQPVLLLTFGKSAPDAAILARWMLDYMPDKLDGIKLANRVIHLDLHLFIEQGLKSEPKRKIVSLCLKQDKVLKLNELTFLRPEESEQHNALADSKQLQALFDQLWGNSACQEVLAEHLSSCPSLASIMENNPLVQEESTSRAMHVKKTVETFNLNDATRSHPMPSHPVVPKAERKGWYYGENFYGEASADSESRSTGPREFEVSTHLSQRFKEAHTLHQSLTYDMAEIQRLLKLSKPLLYRFQKEVNTQNKRICGLLFVIHSKATLHRYLVLNEAQAVSAPVTETRS